MARRFPFPQLLLLLLLLPGSWALSKAQELRRVAGQTLSVRCQYPPRGGPYQSKGWCKEVSKFTCLRLVTSSRPRTLTQISQSSIWDDPAAGFFIVTMTGLKEQDSGHYWCRIYHTSGNSVDRSLRFYLAVSPASASMQATWAPHDLVSSQTQSCVSPTGRARSSPLSVPLSSRQQNPTSHSSPAAPSALVPLLCGLLVAKSLVLSFLTTLLVPCSRCISTPWKTLLELRSLDASKATCHSQQVTDLLWTCLSPINNEMNESCKS
uniref:Natural cytotoxicity triggering receptor 2 n=1 Tax=Equus asinus asinus TaxID=83772 RepID=A0A8C4L575_EQUAS